MQSEMAINILLLRSKESRPNVRDSSDKVALTVGIVISAAQKYPIPSSFDSSRYHFTTLCHLPSNLTQIAFAQNARRKRK